MSKIRVNHAAGAPMSAAYCNTILPNGCVLVESVAHLLALLDIANEVTTSHCAEFFVALNGCGKSSKRICLEETEPLTFWVLNWISDTEETLTGDDWEKSFIFEAISKGGFYCDDPEILGHLRQQVKI